MNGGAKMVDRNGMRAGAGISAIALLLALIFNAPSIVFLVAVALTIGAAFGPARSPLGLIYRGIKSTFKLKIPKEPEEAAPPRFAQLVGAIFLWASLAGFFVVDSDPLGWTLAMIVAALQLLLAVSGICVGCEVYLFSRRIAAKGA